MWFVAIAVPSFIALELVAPRIPAPVRWRAIAAAAALLALNTAAVRLLAVAPASRAAPRIAAAWALTELFAYAVHRAMHRIPWLWRVHRLHHAPGPMAWHRSWWIHPLDVALFAGSTALACTLAGAPLVAAPWFVVLRKLWGILLHANVAWPRSPLDHVVVTPATHHRHHREDLPPANFAGLFSILDHAFGTWAPASREPRADDRRSASGRAGRGS